MSEIAENKIRKNWLYAFLISYGLGLIGMLFSILFTKSQVTQVLGKKIIILMLIFQLVFISGWGYLYYHCAYKKPGRKLLAFHLIITPLSYLYIVLYKLNFLPFAPRIDHPNVIFERTTLMVGLLVSIFLYVFTLKLFKLNKELKKRLVKIDKD
ncbi:MAG: hypothetical protein K940chlam1_00049 [Candidatus Anoxychlamydiales bacterium]|nr:hypothetical protein [Candidatus Anoxychlamydiales bacterium]NGX35484.1 hypothetical protein [Candidatus Anoxychlamydiales bacterium]